MTPKQISPDRYDCAGMGSAELATWLRRHFGDQNFLPIHIEIGRSAHRVTHDNHEETARGLLIAAELEESRTNL